MTTLIYFPLSYVLKDQIYYSVKLININREISQMLRMK